MKLVTNEDTPWMCIKDPNSNLVYWVHSKCACSFYKRIFRRLGWKIITTKEIDWDKNVVFSFIRDPLKKHRLGIIEWFYYFSKAHLLEENANNRDFFEMISNIVYMDIHSMSIKEHLGEKNASKIIWIPIDDPNTNHVNETVKLIELHSSIEEDVKQWALNLPPYHISEGFKKECNLKLMAIPPTPLVVKSLEYDQMLYDKAIKKDFEPENYSMRIAELQNNGLSQQQAEQQADAEVESGEYLNWK